jgi:hypothetical protein
MISENYKTIGEIPIGHLIECAHSNDVVELFIKYDENDYALIETFGDGTLEWVDANITYLTVDSLIEESTIVTDHGFAEDGRPGEFRKKLVLEKHIK